LVVRVDTMRSFVMADIPGLIEGASDGAGLGIRFLKHLVRTRVLLHIVDMYPFDESTPASNAVAIANELERFSPSLAQRERWLVLNKIDMVPKSDRQALVDSVVTALDWDGPVYVISALSGEGTNPLVRDLMNWLEEYRQALAKDPDLLEADTDHRDQVEREARERIQTLAERRRDKRKVERDDSEGSDDDDNDDDYDVEVIYTP